MDSEINQKLVDLLGLNEMSKTEREDFMQKSGEIIIEASVGRLLLSLEEDQVSQLEKEIEGFSEEDDVFAILIKKYPELETILKEEMEAYRKLIEEVAS